MITFVILVLTIFCCTVFGFPIFILGIFALLIAASVVVVIILLERHHRALIDRVTKAEIIEEFAVYKKTLEHSGFSVDFGWRSGQITINTRTFLTTMNTYLKWFTEMAVRELSVAKKAARCMTG